VEPGFLHKIMFTDQLLYQKW